MMVHEVPGVSVSDLPGEFLTTRQLAELLHIKERKVYDLAAAGEVPCSRVTGKLLFERRQIEEWMARHSSGVPPAPVNRHSRVFLGSHDPLLSWALRTSGADLATHFEGSIDGLDRFGRGEGLAAAVHIFEPASNGWNTDSIRARFERAPVALLEFAWRERGLIVRQGEESRIPDIAALRGQRVAPRHDTAASQVLLRHLMEAEGLAPADVEWAEHGGTESDIAIAIVEGKADVAFGLRSMAQQLRLGFVPQVRERFDLLVDRAAWFDPPLQRLWSFCQSDAFRTKARDLGGYDVTGLGTVHFNGA
jgi:excisionase family DNA binding protein